MALDTEYLSDLPALIADLRSVDQKAGAKLRAINVRGARGLLRVARSVVHVKKGNLRDSLFVEGPFDVSSGTFEARVTSSRIYADIEADRGAAHDFAGRTISEGQAIIDQTATDMEDALIALIEGRA
jgi:hypothetical protein